jgi:hypothetical protein
MNEQEVFELPAQVKDALINYLAEKPFKEVAQLLNILGNLKKANQPQQESEE